MSKVKWKCKKCNSIQISDSEEHHKMDYCKCKLSYMDKEEFYYRVGGYVEVIATEGGKTDEQ